MVGIGDILSLSGRTKVELYVKGKLNDILSAKYDSIELVDQVGLQADELTISIPGQYARPKGNDELLIAINDVSYGKFSVQETTVTPHKLNIKAHSANFASSLKERKSRAFDKIKFCKMVEKIAKEHRLKHKCDIDLFIDHLAQHHESDLNLLGRMAKKYNLHFNIKNDTILMLKKAESEVLPLFVVQSSEYSNYSIKHSTKPLYNSCVATWHDTKQNKTKKVRIGKGEPVLVLQEHYSSEGAAHTAAEAALNNITQGSISGTISLKGREIRAGGELQLIGFGEDDGVYSVKKVTHKIDGGGYTISVEFQK